MIASVESDIPAIPAFIKRLKCSLSNHKLKYTAHIWKPSRSNGFLFDENESVLNAVHMNNIGIVSSRFTSIFNAP